MVQATNIFRQLLRMPGQSNLHAQDFGVKLALIGSSNSSMIRPSYDPSDQDSLGGPLGFIRKTLHHPPGHASNPLASAKTPDTKRHRHLECTHTPRPDNRTRGSNPISRTLLTRGSPRRHDAGWPSPTVPRGAAPADLGGQAVSAHSSLFRRAFLRSSRELTALA